jgi:DNA polymerase-1
VNVDLVSRYACEDVDIPIRLVEPLTGQLNDQRLAHLFQSLEMPLIEVLAEMEYQGIRIDTAALQALSVEFQGTIDRLKLDIHAMAGKGPSFNPDSPKQLARLLFHEMKLPVVKKTSTGPSTDVDVLQELARVHPLPAKIMEYRQAVKLKGTYLDALPALVSPKTQRIHTSFRQDVAATGRLSSSDPNLQNIPVRTDEGRRIRAAFCPGWDGWLLLAADYSQIELRVLAHYCGDESLCRAFSEDLDVHAMVASQVHGVPLDQVDARMRRGAKAINFGIIYGQSPFGLAKSLSISKSDASDFIDAYFEKYPGVREFIISTLDEARRQGYVQTMSGRKRWLKGIRDFRKLDAKKRKILLEPERMAINTVIQGSAADMIKMAMIALHRQLQAQRWNAHMLLQIHDELIFEVPAEQKDELEQLVRQTMTTVMPLRVPLKVDVRTGPNWAACD